MIHWVTPRSARPLRWRWLRGLARPRAAARSARQRSTAPIRDAPRPLTASDLWLVPSPEQVNARASLAHAVAELSTGTAPQALPVFAKATSDPVLGGYALLFMGRAQLALGRTNDAAFTARQLLSVTPAPAGYLVEGGESGLRPMRRKRRQDWSGAIDAPYRTIWRVKPRVSAVAAPAPRTRGASWPAQKTLAVKSFHGCTTNSR